MREKIKVVIVLVISLCVLSGVFILVMKQNEQKKIEKAQKEEQEKESKYVYIEYVPGGDDTYITVHSMLHCVNLLEKGAERYLIEDIKNMNYINGYPTTWCTMCVNDNDYEKIEEMVKSKYQIEEDSI